jgi:hypothetical protein
VLGLGKTMQDYFLNSQFLYVFSSTNQRIKKEKKCATIQILVWKIWGHPTGPSILQISVKVIFATVAS